MKTALLLALLMSPILGFSAEESFRPRSGAVSSDADGDNFRLVYCATTICGRRNFVSSELRRECVQRCIHGGLTEFLETLDERTNPACPRVVLTNLDKRPESNSQIAQSMSEDLVRQIIANDHQLDVQDPKIKLVKATEGEPSEQAYTANTAFTLSFDVAGQSVSYRTNWSILKRTAKLIDIEKLDPSQNTYVDSFSWLRALTRSRTE